MAGWRERVRIRMVVDNVLNVNSIPTPVMTFGAFTFAGFFCGYALRKILKIMVLVVSLAFG
jgi:uncharacterized membrane protein (Fun14 family)